MKKKNLDLQISEIGSKADKLNLTTRSPGGPCSPCAEMGDLADYMPGYGFGGIPGGRAMACGGCHGTWSDSARSNAKAFGSGVMGGFIGGMIGGPIGGAIGGGFGAIIGSD
jgi:hypothetical protein